MKIYKYSTMLEMRTPESDILWLDYCVTNLHYFMDLEEVQEFTLEKLDYNGFGNGWVIVFLNDKATLLKAANEVASYQTEAFQYIVVQELERIKLKPTTHKYYDATSLKNPRYVPELNKLSNEIKLGSMSGYVINWPKYFYKLLKSELQKYREAMEVEHKYTRTVDELIDLGEQTLKAWYATEESLLDNKLINEELALIL